MISFYLILAHLHWFDESVPWKFLPCKTGITVQPVNECYCVVARRLLVPNCKQGLGKPLFLLVQFVIYLCQLVFE